MAPSSFSSSISVLDLPVGYIFQPTDEELLGHYLYNKICGTPFKYDVVKEVDLYGNTKPRDIWNEFDGPKLPKNQDLYFFTKLTKVSDKGSRVARKAGSRSGTWKGENSGTKVYYYDAKKKKHLLGLWKRFHYENNNEPDDHQNESWIMHEYSLDESLMPKSSNGSSTSEDHRYVLCRIRRNYRKRKLLVAAAAQNLDDSSPQSQNKIPRLAAMATKNNIGENSTNRGLIISEEVDQLIDHNTVTVTEPQTGGLISDHGQYQPPADQGGVMSTQQPELDYSLEINGIQNDIDDDDFLIDLSSIWDSNMSIEQSIEHNNTELAQLVPLDDNSYPYPCMQQYSNSAAANEEMMMMTTTYDDHERSRHITHQETGQVTDEQYSAAIDKILMKAYGDNQLSDIGFGVTQQMGTTENNNAAHQFDYYGAMQPSFTAHDDQHSSCACLASYGQYQPRDQQC